MSSLINHNALYFERIDLYNIFQFLLLNNFSVLRKSFSLHLFISTLPEIFRKTKNFTNIFVMKYIWKYSNCLIYSFFKYKYLQKLTKYEAFINKQNFKN